MTEKKENYQNEETIFDNKTEKNEKENVKNQTVEGRSKDKSNVKKGVGVAVGAVAGVAAGVAGASVLSSFKMPPEEVENPSETAENAAAAQPSNTEAETGANAAATQPSHFDGEQIPMALEVTDDMSFSEAFAAAREEVGPGGVFFWNDGVYGTYYRNEWANLSDEYKTQFSNYPYQDPTLLNESDNDIVNEPVSELTNEPVEEDDSGEVIDYTEDEVNELSAAEIIDEDVQVADEVELLNVEYVEVDGETITVAPIVIDGENVIFIDGDNDGTYDAVIVNDENDEEVILELQDQNITGQDIIEMEGYTPDYTNDANIENYV